MDHRGRPRKEAAEKYYEVFNKVAEEELEAVIRNLFEAAKGKDKNAVQAAIYILNRLFGMPAQEHIETQNGEIKVTVERIQARSEEEFLNIVKAEQEKMKQERKAITADANL
jgi:hypothetical protein